VSDGEEPEVRYLGDVQRLALAPDDVVVIRCREHISCEQSERLRELARKTLGVDRKVLILCGGLEIGVLAPTGGEAA
jgi:hypothetical protein